MAEYIDREAVLEKLANSSETWAKNIENIRNWWSHAVRIKDNIVAEIKRQPPADVEEVKHGRWDNNGRCTRCGGHAPFYSMASTYYKSPYCFECGAKMYGGEDETK